MISPAALCAHWIVLAHQYFKPLPFKQIAKQKFNLVIHTQDEFLLAATVQNLKTLAKLIPLPAPMPA